MENTRKTPRRSPLLGLLVVASVLLLVDSRKPKQPRCPSSCTCTKDNALCESAGLIPRSFPPDVTSLLFTANNLESINEDAFLGLPHLEYL
ncbi:hypothetical protein INR49_021734 [Caranx melampygus]|nr:hypothetical protein INR49_021734 [Caranx melampygus]